MSEEQQRPITISQQVLRLELDNLALRLTAELATKGEVAALSDRQDAFDRGEMTTGHLLAIKAIVLQELSNARGTVWSLRTNRAQLVAATCVLLSLVVSVSVAVHTWL